MKITALLLTLLVSAQSYAVIYDGDIDGANCGSEPASCTAYTTTSLPTLIVDDVTGEEVWNPNNEELIAQYRAELHGAEIYAIKRYADVRTNGNVEAAKKEIRQYLEALDAKN